MRFLVLGVSVVMGLLAAPLSAATVSATTGISHQMTDWVPWITQDPDDPQDVLLIGSQTFEDLYYYEPADNPFRLPTFDTGGLPFDWIHVSHDLTLRVESIGLAGSVGSFQVYLGVGGPLIGAGLYNRTDGIWTSGKVQSVGSMAVHTEDYEFFDPGNQPQYFFVSGGGLSYRNLGFPIDRLTGETYPDISILELSRFRGTLSGSITVTAGWGGAPEPALGASFVTVSQVPLPASGLMLGAVLLAGAGLRCRAKGCI